MSSNNTSLLTYPKVDYDLEKFLTDNKDILRIGKILKVSSLIKLSSRVAIVEETDNGKVTLLKTECLYIRWLIRSSSAINGLTDRNR